MTKKFFLAVAILLSLSPAARAGNDRCDQLTAESERLWMAGNYDGSDQALGQAQSLCPDRAELYWRQARNDFSRIEAIPRERKPGRVALMLRYRNIEKLADRCIDLDPNDGNCWLWKASSVGRRATTQGMLKSLSEAREVEKYLLKAERLSPRYRSSDGTSNALGDVYDALGQFYRMLPEWLCTIGIKQVVGVCGNLKKSISYLRKAVAREPTRIEYKKDLAVSLICHGQKEEKPDRIEEGKKILASLASMKSVKKTDEIDKQHAKMILADLSLACGYSRDGQQEQSQEAYRQK